MSCNLEDRVEESFASWHVQEEWEKVRYLSLGKESSHVVNMAGATGSANHSVQAAAG